MTSSARAAAPAGTSSSGIRTSSMTPHIGGATHETLLQGAEMIAEEVRRFAAGEPLHYS